MPMLGALAELYMNPWNFKFLRDNHDKYDFGCEGRQRSTKEAARHTGREAMAAGNAFADGCHGCTAWLRLGIMRCAAPVPPASHETMYFCVPLRMAVFLVALSHAIFSWLMLVDRRLVHRELGGMNAASFSRWGQGINDMVDICGIFFGPLGVVGTLTQRTSYVKNFYFYMLLHIPAWLAATMLDLPALWGCEVWQTNPAEARKRYGWVPAMFIAARTDSCGDMRVSFFIWAALSFVLLVYTVMGMKRYADRMDEEPKYSLSVRDGKPDGAFRAVPIVGPGAHYGAPYVGAPIMAGMAPPMMPPMMSPGAFPGPQGIAPPGFFPPGPMAPAGFLPQGPMMPPGPPGPWNR